MSHIATNTSVLFPNFTNYFNETFIFYYYNGWAHDTAIKHRVSLSTGLIYKIKKQLNKELPTASQIFQPHNLPYTEKAALNINPFRKILGEQLHKNNSWDVINWRVTSTEMGASLHFGAQKLSQSVAEQAKLAQVKLFANGNKVQTV